MIYEVSWANKENLFRWVDPDGEVYKVRSAEGEMDMMGTKNEIGRLLVSCVLDYDIDTGHAGLSPAHGSVAELPPAEAVLLSHWSGYCRMCYRKNQNDWRIFDQVRKNNGVKVGLGQLKYVQTYAGRMKVYWYDKGSHLFHGHPERSDGLVSLLYNVAYLH